MSDPLISIIIPVYNVERHIEKCLDSVVDQTYKNLEILLIDDGSSDKSPEICDMYASKDNRIRCIHQINSGVSKARNVGIELATGDYLHFLDSDDYMDPDAYEYLVSIIHEKEVDAVGFEYYTTYLDGNDIPHTADEERYGLRDRKHAVYEHLFGSSNFLCTKLLPMSKISDKRLLTDIFRDEDTLFGLEVISEIDKMYYSDRPLLHYVQSEDSACRGSFRVSQLTALKAIPIMESFFAGNYPEWANKWRLRYMHLMTTLYRDMYMDGGLFRIEKIDVYNAFIDLWMRSGGIKDCTKKNKLKFTCFRFNPDLYCLISKCSSRIGL